jgi:hypothetical protein
MAVAFGLLGVIQTAQRASATALLGTAQTFAVLADTTVTNTGSTIIDGDIGLSPAGSITGVGSITQTGTTVNGGGQASTALADATSAYNTLAALPVTQDLTSLYTDLDLIPATLAPGVYKYDSSAQLSGALTLNFSGPDEAFVFLIDTTLTTASGSSVTPSHPKRIADMASNREHCGQVELGHSPHFCHNFVSRHEIAMK